MRPEQTRLMARLFDDQSRKLINFKISRGEEPCTAEQLCAEINSALDQVESGKAVKTNSLPETGIESMHVDDFLKTITGG